MSVTRRESLRLLAAGAVPARLLVQQQPGMYWAGTPQPVVEAMLDLAQVTAGDVVYDLGSGDGRIPILAAQRYRARGVGIEIQPRLVDLSRQVAREGGVEERVTFLQGDLFAADLSPATVVTLWLNERMNADLEPKLKRELHPGVRVVSHQFSIGRWPPARTVHVENVNVFLWVIN